jgi:hypothetical protein
MKSLITLLISITSSLALADVDYDLRKIVSSEKTYRTKTKELISIQTESLQCVGFKNDGLPYGTCIGLDVKDVSYSIVVTVGPSGYYLTAIQLVRED